MIGWKNGSWIFRDFFMELFKGFWFWTVFSGTNITRGIESEPSFSATHVFTTITGRAWLQQTKTSSENIWALCRMRWWEVSHLNGRVLDIGFLSTGPVKHLHTPGVILLYAYVILMYNRENFRVMQVLVGKHLRGQNKICCILCSSSPSILDERVAGTCNCAGDKIYFHI